VSARWKNCGRPLSGTAFAKRWALGTFHGLRKAHVRRYLDEFVFRWNRRRHVGVAFDTPLGLSIRLGHASYREFISQIV
jgi:hypothetical protein